MSRRDRGCSAAARTSEPARFVEEAPGGRGRQRPWRISPQTMKGVLANRDRIFLLADGLSLVGSGALWLALGIWVKSLTGSSAAAGMVRAGRRVAPTTNGPATA